MATAQAAAEASVREAVERMLAESKRMSDNYSRLLDQNRTITTAAHAQKAAASAMAATSAATSSKHI